MVRGTHRFGLAIALAMAPTACRDADGGGGEGETDGAESGDGDDDGDGGDDDGPEALGCGDTIEVGSTPLRRLTRTEYNNTIRDLLGDDTDPADAFPPDDTALGFESSGHVSPLVAQHYFDAAIAIAERAVADLDTVLPCDSAGDEDGCAHDWIDDFAPRAYRRPLTDEERTSLQDLYAAARAQFSFEESVGVVLETILQSPSFLYRIELGLSSDGDGLVALTHHEMASRLSYLLWSTMPDDALLAAAQDGELHDPEVLEAQARRMLDDPRAEVAVASFHRQWLGVEPLASASKDAAMFPEWSDTLRDAMIAEAGELGRYVVFEDDARLETLLTAPIGFANAELAALYGISGVDGDALQKVDLPPEERSGILTQAGVLAQLAKADQSDPVLRGKFVRERLLCQTLPAPPPDVDVTPPDVDPDSTTRERFSQHSEDPTCAGCHILLDPLGFGFENYDALGRYRTTEAGQPIDASGELVSTRDIDGTFDGAVELGVLLAGSEEVRECVATQWFRYAFGRAERDADECTQSQIYDAFAAADYDIQELLVGLVLSDGFRFRPAIEEGQ